MTQTRIAKTLKAACLLAALIGLPLTLLGGPMMADAVRLTHGWPDGLFYALLVPILITAGLCYAALWRFYAISVNIGQDRSFSLENARAMAGIARALGLAALLMAAVFLLWWLPVALRGRGLRIVQLYMPLMLALGLTGLSVLAWALQQLVARAASLQEAQDLTI